EWRVIVAAEDQVSILDLWEEQRQTAPNDQRTDKATIGAQSLELFIQALGRFSIAESVDHHRQAGQRTAVAADGKIAEAKFFLFPFGVLLGEVVRVI
ncbi:MAG: hypothetical protein B5M51_07275, partial [Anaerolinea sp. 4484_236]